LHITPPPIVPLPLPDALPISSAHAAAVVDAPRSISSGTWFTTTANAVNVPSAAAATRSRNGALREIVAGAGPGTPARAAGSGARSEEHTSELQSREQIVCRLL